MAALNLFPTASYELPRLTRSLRAFTELEDPALKNLPQPDPEELLRKARELRKKRSHGSLTWENLKKDLSLSSGEGFKLVNQLWHEAKELTPQDPQEVTEDAAIQLIQMFWPEKQLLRRHIEQLKNQFGSMSYNKAVTIFEVVKKLGDLLDETTLKGVEGKVQDSPSWMFGSDIKYTDIGGAPRAADSDLISKLRDFSCKDPRESYLQNFNVKYEGSLAEDEAQRSITSKSAKFGLKWLRTEIMKFYNTPTPAGLPIEEFLDAIVERLRQEKSNDALQDELFDFLGFDRFQLIQKLLQHRGDIVYTLSLPKKEDLPKPDAKRPTISSQVVVQLDYEKQIQKLARKEEKKLQKALARAPSESSDEDEEINLRNVPSLSYTIQPPEPQFNKLTKRKVNEISVYPHVYDIQREVKQTAGFISGVKMMLPLGVEKVDKKTHEEVHIPLSDPVPTGVGDKKVKTETLNEIGRIAFDGIAELNRIQSVVFNTAYYTNENLLICAPTGAGKTNVALLTVVHQIEQHVEMGVIKKDSFKIVYVAPMKALASEMTRSFGKRLEPLGLSVRELTGDMQLTKKEILETQMLITTPEKWDVVTRKGTGDVALTKLVKLLIIDEVHLLHGDRGPVVEALVARTLRQVESSQSMIRIVGLSATLPNYLDVARFLRVNPQIGLFYFDARFRPVPLAQTFIGVKATKPIQQMMDMDLVCFEKVLEQVQRGEQVMVFVHARNATVRTANVLKEMAAQKNQLQAFEPDDTNAFNLAKRTLAKFRNRQVAELFQFGLSCHHAGMLRSDRTAVEKLFADGLIKVLVCTSTLAWGVNLPAHAVIIRGTEIYDAKRGTFVDLDILDVLQIFGRAGRPQFDKSGHGIIVTTYDRLTKYLSLLTNQFPIESNFINFLSDNLNAEITLGTISNLEEAVQWLSYTYLYVRMKMNPQVYGINYTDVADDPQLVIRRQELIHNAAKALDKARMIRYNERTGDLSVTDLGRTASHFYIKYNTIEVFNEMLHPIMTDSEVLNMVSHSQEFEQLKVRDEELEELDRLTHDCCEIPVTGGSENLHGKVNILLQTYLSRGSLESFSLISDQSYIIQNAVRIMRSLFDIALRKNNALMASRFLTLSKMFELQMWETQSPLRQFPTIGMDMICKVEEKNLSIDKIVDMSSREIGAFLRNPKMGQFVQRCASEIPHLDINATLQPITRTILRIKLQLTAKFKWNDRVHGKTAEHFWIWVEDPDNNYIYHHEYFLITKRQVVREEPQELVMTIPLSEPLPPQYYVRAVSDRWLGSDCMEALSFQHLILPETHPPHTDLLPLQPLPVTALQNAKLEQLFPFSHFNPIQTQIFHSLYHSDTNLLLGAPTGSGKTIAAEIAMFRVFHVYQNAKVVYIAPMKALVRERMEDWKVRLEIKLGFKVVELTGDVTPDVRAIAAADVIVTTPEKWDGVSRSWQTRNYVKDVALIVIDEIHLLGEDRGPVLEVIVSRTNFISSHTSRKLRVIGLSTALANARDLANWLGIGEMGLFNFRPSVRPVPLEVHISGFPGKHYCPRMATMNRPAFQAIRQHSPAQPSLIFVSSRRQTRLTALDLIAYLAAEEDQKQWLHMGEEEIDQIVSGIKDQHLKLTLVFGIGMHHAGLTERDRKTVEELFVNQKIQVLITTATLAWGVNFPAHLVIVKGTEYYDGKLKRYIDMPITDVLQMMGRAGRPQYDDHGVAVVFVHDIKKNFYKKFLYEPFPVESSLLEVLPNHLNAEIVAGTVRTKQEALDYLTWTYFFRRLLQNPTYYNLEGIDPKTVNSYLSNLIERTIKVLDDAYCVQVQEDNRSVEATSMGRIASYYYLSHQTMHHFRETLQNNMTIEQLLEVLCDAYEYSQIPVRHNEDILNGEFAKKCPLPVKEYALDSSATKAHLLFQAHFSHLQLPCADYYTDLKSVLDQAIRILQAIVDVTAEQGWLASCLRAQQLMQMVIQAAWVHESPLLTLPHIETYHLQLLRNRRMCLPNLLHASKSDSRILYDILEKELEGSDIEDMYSALKQMPIIEMSLSLQQEESEEIKLPHRSTKGQWITLTGGSEQTLIVRMNRLRGLAKRQGRGSAISGHRAYTPRFPRGADESWFLVLGCIETEELIALKRIAPLRGNTSTQVLSFSAPSHGRHILTLYLISSCYLGLDQQLSINVEATKQQPSEYKLFPVDK